MHTRTTECEDSARILETEFAISIHHILGQKCSGAICGWMGWDLCVGLLYEHRFAVLIIIIGIINGSGGQLDISAGCQLSRQRS